MSDAPTSISDLISKWPTIVEFAEAVGCGYEAARQMRRRDRIAPEHWSRVIQASQARQIAGVTWEWLAERVSAPSSAMEPTP